MKAGTQERGTEHGTECGMERGTEHGMEHRTKHGTEHGTEIRCKVHHDERACVLCEGAHGYRHKPQGYSLAVLVCRFRRNIQVCLSVYQFRTLQNDQVEIIDLTLSDSDSDGDFIQAKKAKVEPKPPSPRRGHCVQGETLVLRSSNTKMKLMPTAENTCFNRRCV